MTTVTAMGEWLKSIDGWTWVKVASLMLFAAGVGLLKRKQFDDELREHQERERQRDRMGRFTDPFDN
jgi:hypothetical protein